MIRTDEERKLTTAEACDRLGCHPSQLRLWIKAGEVTQERTTPPGVMGRVYYRESEIAALAAKWKPKKRRRIRKPKSVRASKMRGEVAAIILPLYLAGKPLIEMCIAARAEPALVQDILGDLRDGVDGKRVREERARRIEQERRDERERYQRERHTLHYENLAKLERAKKRA